MLRYLGIGEMAVGKAGDTIKTVLGSCVGICLWDCESRTAGLAHVMFHTSEGHDDTLLLPGKYADTAVKSLFNALRRKIPGTPLLVAKVAGGSAIFARPGSREKTIGEMNIEAVKREIGALGIPVIFEDTGGPAGRSVTLDCATGELAVRMHGKAGWKESERSSA